MNEKPTLSQLVRSILEQIVRESIESDSASVRASGSTRTLPGADDSASDTDSEENTIPPSIRIRKPARRRRSHFKKGPRVSYELVKRDARKQLPYLFTTAEQVYKFMLSQRGKATRITAADIEKGTGLGKKTVESVIYHLRHLGLIRSVEL